MQRDVDVIFKSAVDSERSAWFIDSGHGLNIGLWRMSFLFLLFFGQLIYPSRCSPLQLASAVFAFIDAILYTSTNRTSTSYSAFQAEALVSSDKAAF